MYGVKEVLNQWQANIELVLRPRRIEQPSLSSPTETWLSLNSVTMNIKVEYNVRLHLFIPQSGELK
jgi:hypothetical protein